MTSPLQRFCPLCDRSFDEGEAVLRCEGCGVLYHPACWVRNDGCSTAEEHQRTPLAVAYSASRLPVSPASHPGEGVRISATPTSPTGRAPYAQPERDEGDDAMIGQHVIGEDDPEVFSPPDEPPPPVRRPARQAPPSPYEPVIGGTAHEIPPPVAARRRPPDVPYRANQPVPPPRRPRPRTADVPVQREMPRVYRGNPFLTYWYVPAAVAVAVGVAVAVIFLAEALFGDSAGVTPAAVTTTPPVVSRTAAASGTAGPSTTPTTGTATGTVAASATPVGTAPPDQQLAIGDTAVVGGTGECLNVRKGPGTGNESVACVPDGTEVVVREGPANTNDGYTWWTIQTPQGSGWAVGKYLVKR